MKPRQHQLFRLSCLVAVVLLAVALSHPAYAQAHHTTFKANGAFGGAFTCDQFDCHSISVSRDRSGGSVTTNLYFRIERRDPVTGVLTYAFGAGAIPNEDLTGDTNGLAANFLRLNTNIATNPDFFAIAFTCDDPNNPGCHPFPLGVITATVTANNLRSGSEHTTREDRYKLPDGSSVTTRFMGHADFSSATVTANVFGIAVNFRPGDGSIGAFKGATMTIEKTAH